MHIPMATLEVSSMMNDATKKTVLARIRRIAGQLEGVARMIEQDATAWTFSCRLRPPRRR